MRFDTNLRNKNTFYTDLNGFQVWVCLFLVSSPGGFLIILRQMRKRQTLSKIPLNGNFFPITSQMFIQDNHSRVSLHVESPAGSAALKQVRVFGLL